jgi:hypothetical protein
MWTGTLEWSDLGTGTWTLISPTGQRLQLLGDIPAKLSGKAVKVHGQELEAMGIAMVGPIIQVERISAA